jgi:hypothetical protein
MQVATKFLRLTKPVALGDRIDGWRVCWIGGWDRCRVLFVVMLEKQEPRVPKRRFVPGCSFGEFGTRRKITGLSPGVSEERR